MTARHETRTIDLTQVRDRGIAVVSDTHGRPHPSLFPTLEKIRPSLILHAGDIGDLDLITEMEPIAQTVYVRGNTDPAGPKWPDAVSLRVELGTVHKIDLLLIHFAVLRLRLNREVISLLQENPAQIVAYGHSHIPFLGKQQNTVLFNPGSAGPPRMGLPTTMGFIEISDRIRFKHLDLRTGGQWVPG